MCTCLLACALLSFSLLSMTAGPCCYFLAALCVLGITANLLTLVVLWHNRHKKKSTSWLLQALAVVDSVYLLARLLAVVFQFGACRHGEWLPLVVGQWLATISPYMASGASTMHIIGVWTVVVVTVDRYVAIYLPNQLQLRTVRCAKAAVALVTLSSVVCCLPLFVAVFQIKLDQPISSLLSPLVPEESLGAWHTGQLSSTNSAIALSAALR